MFISTKFTTSVVSWIEKKKLGLLLGFSILYFVVTYLIASQRLMWNDELHTYYITRLPGFSDVWSALLTGAEQLPPFFYVVTRLSVTLFGENQLAIRLPALIGFWGMCLCLYRFVSKHTSPLYGLIAMLFPLIIDVYSYSFEGRPYGMLLGFGGLALISWQTATEGSHRKIALAGIALSLAAAIAIHYYAVLLLFPLMLAEIVRTLSRRKTDLCVWAMMLLGLVPLLCVIPLIKQAATYSSGFWTEFGWNSIQTFYFYQFAPAILPILALLILTAMDAWIRPNWRANSEKRIAGRFPLHELIALLGLILTPVVALIAAFLVTGAFTDRYVLQASIGMSALIAVGMAGLFNNRAHLAVVFIFLIGIGFLARGVNIANLVKNDVKDLEATVSLMQSECREDLPIVLSDSHIFTKLSYYGPPEVATRLLYLADPDASLRYLGHNSVEKGMLDLLKPWFNLNVQEYDAYRNAHHRFYLYGDPEHFLNWVMRDLQVSGQDLQLKGQNQEMLLFLVDGQKNPQKTASIQPLR